MSFDPLRPPFVFMHIEKTGGTSLYDALTKPFGADACSPPHMAYIQAYTLAELNRYEMISGHIRYPEALILPRLSKKVVTVFRDPVDRLISFYRFHRAHPDTSEHHFVALAQGLSPEAFFQHESVRAPPRIDNQYLRFFADVVGETDKFSAAHAVEAVALAKSRVRAVFDQSAS